IIAVLLFCIARAAADLPCIHWSNVLTPRALDGAAMAYDSERQVTVLFGGRWFTDRYLNETLEWDGTDWTMRSTQTWPYSRYGDAMAYDSARQVTVLFGGGGPFPIGDTWEWNGATWTQRTPSVSPSARSFHAMAYVSGRGVTVLFGGSAGPG